jgi:hypothetical protein
MDTNVYRQAKVLDNLGRQLELTGKSQKSRNIQLEYVLGRLEYLHYRPNEMRRPTGEHKLQWKPKKWDYAESRYWVLEKARYEYYRYLAMTNPNRFANELYRIEISEDRLRRGRRVRLPEHPEGILESWSWGFGVAVIWFDAHDPVRRQIDLVVPHLVRVDYEAMLNGFRIPRPTADQVASA